MNMNIIKKSTAVLLALLMALSIFQLGIFAAKKPDSKKKIKNVVIRDVTCIENDSLLNCYTSEGEIPDYAYPTDITVYFTDGTSKHFDGPDSVEHGTGYSFTYYADYFDGKPWEIGKHTAVAQLGGKEYKYNVFVVESPVESITAEKMTIDEYKHGDWRGSYDDNAEWVNNVFYEYDLGTLSLWNKTIFTVKYKDGKVLKGTLGDIKDETGELIWFSPQTWDNYLSAGENTFTVNFLGAEGTILIDVKPCNIESIEIGDVTCHEGTASRWYYDGKKDYPVYGEPNDITVHFKDGTSQHFTGIDDVLMKTYYQLDYCSNYIDDNAGGKYEKWGQGVHKATAFMCGLTCTYKVTVAEPVPTTYVDEEDIYDDYEDDYDEKYDYADDEDEEKEDNNPTGYSDSRRKDASSVTVKSIRVNGTVNLNEFSSYGYLDNSDKENPYFRYRLNYLFDDVEFTVTLSDGTEFTGDRWEIDQKIGYKIRVEDLQSRDNPLTVGNNNVKITCAGCEYKANVNLEPTTIESVSIGDVTCTEGIADEWFFDGDEDCPIYGEPDDIEVVFTDGTSQHFESEDDFRYQTGYSFEVNSNYSSGEYENWDTGSHTASAAVGGKEYEYNVEIIESAEETQPETTT